MEMVHVSDGSEYSTRGLTADGVEGLQELLADIRTGDGGIRQFLIELSLANDRSQSVLPSMHGLNLIVDHQRLADNG
ncbi:hypothetical protein E5S70_33785 [Ensifer adhaerens]|nr:hypothetical protein [Ensifer canadensis]